MVDASVGNAWVCEHSQVEEDQAADVDIVGFEHYQDLFAGWVELCQPIEVGDELGGAVG